MKGTIEYHPKGSMCMNCIKSAQSCDHLPFHQMKPHNVYYHMRQKITVVICSDYKKLDQS